MEMNPALRVMVNGNIEQHRYMTLQATEEWGEGKIRLWLPSRAFGPQGFQINMCRKLVLYMTMDEFDAAITGKFCIDLIKYCIPPKIREDYANDEAVGMPKIGTRMPDGTTYVGRSPHNPDLAMLAEPRETFRASFKGAQRRARKQSLITGQDCHVPSPQEWETIFKYRQYDNKLMRGFNRCSGGKDALCWTSKSISTCFGRSVNTLTQVTADEIIHNSHLFSKAAKASNLGVCLVRTVPTDVVIQMNP
jgi:hypothetical protein